MYSQATSSMDNSNNTAAMSQDTCNNNPSSSSGVPSSLAVAEDRAVSYSGDRGYHDDTAASATSEAINQHHQQYQSSQHHAPSVLSTTPLPAQGDSGTTVTVLVPASLVYSRLAPRRVFCIAFGQLILSDTRVLLPSADNRDCVSLICNAPPRHHLHILPPVVSEPVYVCLLENDALVEVWFAGQFTYTSDMADAPSTNQQQQHHLHDAVKQETMDTPKLLTQAWPRVATTPSSSSSSSSSSSYMTEETKDQAIAATTTSAYSYCCPSTRPSASTVPLPSSLPPLQTQQYINDGSTSGPCMTAFSQQQEYYEPNSTAFAPAKRYNYREHNGNTRPGVAANASVSTAMFNVAQQQRLRSNVTDTAVPPTMTRRHSHHHLEDQQQAPGSNNEKRSKKSAAAAAGPDMGGVTWQDYVPYPKVDRPVQLEMLSDFDRLSQNWTEEETKAGRRLIRFWRLPTTYSPSFSFHSNTTNTNTTTTTGGGGGGSNTVSISSPSSASSSTSLALLFPTTTASSSTVSPPITVCTNTVVCDFCILSEADYRHEFEKQKTAGIIAAHKKDEKDDLTAHNHGQRGDDTSNTIATAASSYYSTVISCIAFQNDLFVTSVDLIHLLECIMRVTLTIDEKNRIRRNLEGFHPITASKYSNKTADLFRHVMNFGNPIPRSIEKDLKIFHWHILPYALKKILAKYLTDFDQGESAVAAALSTMPMNAIEHNTIPPPLQPSHFSSSSSTRSTQRQQYHQQQQQPVAVMPSSSTSAYYSPFLPTLPAFNTEDNQQEPQQLQ
ncbi:hypothetical protein BDB00DRAFT_221434 [Zychaea mexicana]|uniref:uncharacterized protein n=1 Tax=Zychaea mexicana TaxID=64656 RepID=UPI0022FE9E7D|nr:uncharacterized protein BDB00DRAFT_221434 [Zychaea mexicana]KAI9499167.1 hypothetical protein BDB00DRAFT_221434 [Zychaea mexicana]